MPLGVGFLIVKRKVGGMREAPSVWGGLEPQGVCGIPNPSGDDGGRQGGSNRIVRRTSSCSGLVVVVGKWTKGRGVSQAWYLKKGGRHKVRCTSFN